MAKEFAISKAEYEKQLMRGVSLSGQSREHFIRWRIKITKHLLKKLPKRILDFGCGEGASYPFLKEAFPESWVDGYEPSEQLARTAKGLYGGQRELFMSKLADIKVSQYDLVYTNGVFHHIKPEIRPEVLKRIRDALASEGNLAFWENNPWHIGTRLVMSRIPFDREAQTISPSEGKKILKNSGFKCLFSVSAFHLPFLEKVPWRIYSGLLRNQLGAQYLLLVGKAD